LDAATGDVNNPNITLRYSNDGGVTWQADKVITGGATGDYTKRLSWRRLGKSRDRVFEVETSQNSQVIWRDAYVRATSENGTDA
jgi:Neuraminidase (sialidase)